MTKHINKLHAGCMSNFLRKKTWTISSHKKACHLNRSDFSLPVKPKFISAAARRRRRRRRREEKKAQDGGVGEPVLPPDPVFRGEGARWLQMPPAPLSTPKVQGRPNHPFNPRRMRGVRARTVLPNLPGGGLWGFGLGCHGCSLKR